jgi:predicted outer membrane repeat protein
MNMLLIFNRNTLCIPCAMLVLLFAITGRSDDSALDSWLTALAQPDGPSRSAPATPQVAVEAKQQLRLMLRDSAPQPLKALTLSAPEQVAADGASSVWRTEASGSSGEYRLAMKQTGSTWRPLYFSITGLPQVRNATFDDALKRVRSILLHDKTDQLELSALRSPAHRDSVALETWRSRPVEMPWDAAWVFMVDDAPLANWAHPCRYVFLSEDLSTVAVRYALTPLTTRPASTAQRGSTANELEVIIPFVYPETPATPVQLNAVDPTLHPFENPVSNCYAVIISGGYDKDNNHIRYWGDVSHIYSTLSLKYGYPKTNIYTLVSDGLDPAADTSDDTNSPFDLDGDGRNDTMAAATAGNISNVFAHLRATLTTNDQLFVFTTDHGGPTEGAGEWDVELNLWNMEVLRDHELKAMTENIACPVFFVMEQCYSGGFLNDLNRSNSLISTAAHYNESSYAGNTFPWFDQWAYHWTAAMRGAYPQTNAPWLDSEPCDGDLNDDGYVSFAEAAQYAYTHKYSSDHPMYSATPGGLGEYSFLQQVRRDDLGMGQLVFDPVPSLLVSNTPTPVRITAQNVFGDTITNYTGPVTLSAVAAPIDPGFYVGDGDILSPFPLNTTYMDSRVQVIYPADIMGGERTLDYIQLDVAQPPTLTMSNLTIRMKHTPMTFYPDDPVWETEDWTTVYVSNLLLTATGWVTFAFSEPFHYDGTNSLMIDFSLHNEAYDNGGSFRVTYSDSHHVSIGYLSDNEDGDPLTWSNAVPRPELSPAFPNLRFGPPPIPVTVQITPTNLPGLVNGVCTGMVTVLNTATDVYLYAADHTNAAWNGESTTFAILSACLTNYADSDAANPVYPFTTWETAATSLQAALDAAQSGGTVLATNGCYDRDGAIFASVTNRALVGSGITLRSINGPSVTHIVGSADPHSSLGPSAIRGAALLPGAAISGFTIRSGHTDTNGNGGGILAADSTAISNCIVRNNSARNGGGIHTTGQVTITTCMLNGNSAAYAGGGIYCAGTGDLAFCTITTNHAEHAGGGVYLARQSRLLASIVYGNTAGFSGENLYDASGTAVIEYCCILPDPGGTGNVTGDPAFNYPATNDYRLTSGSSCIDSGPVDALPCSDIDGTRRPLDGLGTSVAIIDIGACEFFNQEGDTDADGMRDGWENLHGLNVYDPTDAAQNPDGDPADNYTEALADTDPFNSESYLFIELLAPTSAPILCFQPASTTRMYTVRTSESLTISNWTNVPGATHFIPDATGAQSIHLQDTPFSNAPRCFYRLKVEYP